jgi:hypothetical protein
VIEDRLVIKDQKEVEALQAPKDLQEVKVKIVMHLKTFD